MEQVRNLDGKLVCNIQQESGAIEIVKKDCVTRINFNPDGTFQVSHERITAVA